MGNFRLIFSRSETSLKQKKGKALTWNTYSQFNLLFLSTLMLSLTGVSLVNFIVDPYDIFRYHNPLEAKLVKPEKLNYDRLYKTIDIINIKPEVIILGSSRAKQGLNPKHPGFPTDKTVYNLGIDGSNTYEILRYLEHSYANQPNLKKVILGVDHYMFNDFYKLQDSFDENRLGKTHITATDLLNSLFSQDALIASKNTIQENLSLSKNTQDLTYGDNGFFPHREPNDGKTQWRFTNTINQYFGFHKQYKLSEAHLNNFKKIVEFCRKNNIELIVFISPSHVTQWEALRVTNRWDSFEKWKRKMVEITPVWDFSGYNSITTEPIKDVMTNYVDNSHYTPGIGDLVLNRILSHEVNQVPQDFGFLMTPENIDAHLAKIRSDRSRWAKIQQNEVELVENLKRNFDKSQKSQLK
ncbi:hypothetical protein VB715_05005 [Crocosphaera sp. UHCC 0190]|uniref:hypothetical protein n=1 Tax=Crocosphaera sp. UHCC 0190 TaxID=3110246 RepID=UPI002B21C1BB|nr:hypothetical protein [Crocosphaera sp. UHCC 0190]MEA5509117.1 hypothetical protein [Crocosphaera sp. UHCC 0190]